MSARETAVEALQRWRRLELLQRAYPEFVPFLRDIMTELGFKTSEIQEDIALWMQHGPDFLMVQAQRGQAKTTIAAIFAVWNLIHDPTFRVLIVSAGETQANEISTLIVRIINSVDILEMLRPDSSQGDRTSVEHYDVHYSLKGIDKSPSVACVGINSNLPGKRADLLIPDDIESNKNSLTATARAQLAAFTQEFSSISVNEKPRGGRIIWLGTPQSVDSVYNGLPGRGVAVRIWPGRIPTEEQEQHYGDALAPIIKRKIAEGAARTGYGLDGNQGEAVDPLLRSEEALLKQEMDKGAAGFQLQFMLLTAMTDALRHPLKTERIIAIPMLSEYLPIHVVPGFGKRKEVMVNGQKYSYSIPHEVSSEVGKLPHTTLYLDPAGGGVNADETGWAFGGLLNSHVYVKGWGGLPGGHTADHLDAVAALAVRLRPSLIKVEKNFGYGLYMTALRPVVTAAFDKAGLPHPAFDEDYVTGQKEARIIDVLEPVLGRGALIFDEELFLQEAASVQQYEPRLRNTYSGLFQLTKLTRDRKSLAHDDRVDALAGLVNHYGAALAVDHKKALDSVKKREYERLMKNPLSLPKYALQAPRPQNLFKKRVRQL